MWELWLCWGCCFNPHSSFRPSATEEQVRYQEARLVSILTRAFARVQRSETEKIKQNITRFQSSLELSPECNPNTRFERCGWVIGFNPHSSFRPSATHHLHAGFQRSLADGFNPHSSFRPSATPYQNLAAALGHEVSILTRAFARVQRAAASTWRRQ